MGNRKRRGSSRAWGIGGVVVVGALVLGLSGFALSESGEAPTNAGSVPALPETAATPTPAKPLRAAFVGDSYTQGAGSTGADATIPELLSARETWIPTNLGHGGTGYITSADKQACGLDYCPTYLETLPEIIEADPEVVFVSGGRNDISSARTAPAAIADFYSQLRAALPNAQIIAVSPLWDDDPAPDGLGTIAAAVQVAVEDVNGTYLDIGQPLEGRTELMSEDGIHPADDGYALIVDTIDPLIPAR
jgi:lysophospholipase L1-like esterase